MEPEQQIINWQLICRICLGSNSEMKCIFGDAFEDSLVSKDVVAKIIKCGGVPVSVMDGMPDRICGQCLNDLEIAFTFRNTCQESYYQLLKFVKTKEQDGIKIEDDATLEFKVETKFGDSDHSSEPNSRRESLDIDYSPEQLPQNQEDAKPSKDEINYDAVQEELASPIIKSTNRKPKSKLNTDKTSVKRGRKPNPVNKFICHICGNIYEKQSRLNQHIKRHTEEKLNECEICGKKFSATAQISRHMNTHTGNRPYKCSYCPSSFADSSTRNKHQRIHTNERPFKCSHCGKAFAYTNVLKVHMAIHTGERPYSCSYCGKGFSQRHHQQTHERTHTNSNRNAKLKL